MSVNLIRSEQARERLERWYRVFCDRLPVATEHRDVPTSLGPSHVLLAGDPARPPLVAVHAMRTGSAHVMLEMGPLLERFRVIAPDVPGQSVRGPQVRLPLHDDSAARWLLEVLDGLGVREFSLFGVSWGGFVARQTATVAPGRVQQLALLVPAGVVGGPLVKGLMGMALPMLMYRLRPNEPRLRRLLDPLFTTWDDDWAHFMGDVLRDFPPDLRIPPLATDEQLRGLTMPTLVMAADRDISFPGEKLLRRVKSLVPRAEVELIPNCKHCPPFTDTFRRWLADRITSFLAANGVA